MTSTPEQQRIQLLEVALQMIDNLLDHPINDIGRRNAQEIIRHALREASQ